MKDFKFVPGEKVSLKEGEQAALYYLRLKKKIHKLETPMRVIGVSAKATVALLTALAPKNLPSYELQ